MTLSPMEPNVSTNSHKVMSVERSTQKKSILGLKSSEWAFCFQQRGSTYGVDQRSSSRFE
jgi:hypothetical protein